MTKQSGRARPALLHIVQNGAQRLGQIEVSIGHSFYSFQVVIKNCFAGNLIPYLCFFGGQAMREIDRTDHQAFFAFGYTA